MRKTKWFWVWQDEKEEAWLGEMALTGWKLESVQPPWFYNFVRSKPSNAYYYLDFPNPQKIGNLNQYITEIQADGWEYVGKMGGWQYLRRIIKSKAEKYQHVMTFLVGFLPVMLLWFPLLDNRLCSPFYEIFGLLYIILLILFTLSICKIYRHITGLRKL